MTFSMASVHPTGQTDSTSGKSPESGHRLALAGGGGIMISNLDLLGTAGAEQAGSWADGLN